MLIPGSGSVFVQALAVGLAAATFSVASPAQATTIDFSSTSCSGAACGLTGSAADGNLNLTTSSGGVFSYKTVSTKTGLGVTDLAGDPTPGEIDVDEFILGQFTLGWRRQDREGSNSLFVYNGPDFRRPVGNRENHRQ